jgi:AraC-like DNA-binding protein
LPAERVAGSSLSDLTDYLASPVGKAVASAHVLVWMVSRELRIIALWGRGNEEDARFLVDAMAHEVGPACRRYGSIVDLRAVEDLPQVGFDAYFEFARAHRDTLGTRVIHSAIVHRGGASAALVAGYSRLLDRPFPSSLHATLAGALRALGQAAEVTWVPARLAALIAEARGRYEVAGLVEAYLRATPRAATLRGCARALGVAERTLQRALHARGTSFRQALARARVDLAMHLLRETDDKLLVIAHEVGYPKAQNLSLAFRKRTGMTPGAWRARVRSIRARS